MTRACHISLDSAVETKQQSQVAGQGRKISVPRTNEAGAERLVTGEVAGGYGG